MRSVDADALLNEMTRYNSISSDDCISMVKSAPTIDKPVVVMFDTARWERDVNDNVNIMIRFGWKCSACEKRQSYGMTPHCPFCGAEMINGSKFQEGE